jgi:hypothetical protein
MKFLRSTEKKTRRNIIRNEIPTEVGTQNLLTELEEKQLQWSSHKEEK